jgi:threonine synthase
VLEVRGSFDEILAAARELARRGTHALVNSLNPYRIEGQKTAAFEIVDELGAPPDVLVIPYGGGGNTQAYFKGFAELSAGVPRILAAESSVRANTFASAIRIVDPVHAAEVVAALEACGGSVCSISDDSILDAWRSLAREEGVFCEPASAASLAAVANADLPRGARVVCVITGHGLKDPEAVTQATPPPLIVDPDPDEIAAAA